MEQKLSFEEIVKLVEQLEPELQDLLMLHIRNLRSPDEQPPPAVSHEELLEELRRTRSAAVVSSVYAVFTKPADATEAGLKEALKEAEQKLKQDLIGFGSDSEEAFTS
jgi:hypothetical protein